MSRTTLAEHTWPAVKAHDAVASLARAAGLVADVVTSAASAVSAHDTEDLGQTIVASSQALGIDIETVAMEYSKIGRSLTAAAPCIIRVVSGSEQRLLVLLQRGARRAVVLAPDLTRRRISVATLRAWIAAPLALRAQAHVEELLSAASLPTAHGEQVREALSDTFLMRQSVTDIWLLRPFPGSSFTTQLRRHGILRQLGAIMLSYAALNVLNIATWGVLGAICLSNTLDVGLLGGWVLLFATQVPSTVAGAWLEGRLSYKVAALLRLRILDGTLKSDLETAHIDGVGRQLGRITELQTLESVSVDAGFFLLLGAVEIVVALAVVLVGAGAGTLIPVLGAALGALGIMAWRYHVRLGAWTRNRRELTNALIERMSAHRTRLAQADPKQWHRDEDEELVAYLARSSDLDKTSVRFGVLPRIWTFIALAGLWVATAGSEIDVVRLAVALGGILLVERALAKLGQGFAALSLAVVAFEQVKPQYRDAAGPNDLLHPAPDRWRPGTEGPLLEGRQLSFRYQEDAPAVFRQVDAVIRHGQRVLLVGPSGAGKSTMVGILTGLYRPSSGVVLLGGLDRSAVGSQVWRKHVVGVPQFHQNHILAGSLAYNLLLGRSWPASPSDYKAAEAICRELELGDLIDRMPSGLMQMVGETGWRLSHGERSRVYLARALLQDGAVLVLDESFGALDPQSLVHAMRTSFAHSGALIVIAHP